MSEWLGLHNPERHETGDGYEGAYCSTCLNEGNSAWCYSDSPCYCCLTAEVERLTSDITDHWLPMGEALATEVERLQSDLDEQALILKAHTEALADQDRRIAEVLALCDEWNRHAGDTLPTAWATGLIREALDGDA